MIFTFGYAKQKLAKFVDSGACPDNEVVADRINEAVNYILGIEDWHLTTQRMRFYTSRNVIVLPYFAERIINCRPDVSMDDARGMYAGQIFSRTYEFMEHGPLNTMSDGSGLQALADLGDGYCTMFEADRDLQCHLAAFSTEPEDIGRNMEVRGTALLGHELLTLGSPGQTVKINRWRGGIEGDIDQATYKKSEGLVNEVSHVVKPVTKGYITLLAIDPLTNKTFFLAKYHPHETVPGFRRYKVINPDMVNGTCWTAMVKLRYVPATHDNDPLLVQNMPALKAMIQALRENDAGNLEKKIAFTKDCLWLLKQQQSVNETRENEFQIVDDFGMGDIY